MLVLSRKINETIRIGADVRITLLNIEGGSAKIGIDAPRSLSIVREELLTDTVSTNVQALKAPKTIQIKKP
ncbi:MAG: carbon storage regulator CsrA [Oscillospiraceae bacterium]|jgi:carbon storage regulator|nr:carbon storage regulator CsrA [Oscillospiraceae bacterium]